MPDIRVLLLDDRPLAQMGIRSMLSHPGIEVVGAVASIDEAVALGVELKPTVVLVNSQNGGADPAEATATLTRMLSPKPCVLVLVNSVDEDAHRAVRAGAAGLLLEQSSQVVLVSAVRAAASGYVVLAPWTSGSGEQAVTDDPADRPVSRLDLLTQREYDVFELIACARSNASISTALSLSENTVKSHVRSVLSKLGLRNRVAAAIYAHDVSPMRSRPGGGGRPSGSEAATTAAGRSASVSSTTNRRG